MEEIIQNLRDQGPKLKKIAALLDSTKRKICKDIYISELTTIQVAIYRDHITATLYKIGEMGWPVSEIRDQLEESYTEKYPSAPAMAKKLWITKYESLHKPYDRLKNKCHNMLQFLDKNETN